MAEHPELPGCMAQGATVQDALKNLDEVREFWIDEWLADGLELPEPINHADITLYMNCGPSW
jgi:predicted RNase H-like HicB family nuclease